MSACQTAEAPRQTIDFVEHVFSTAVSQIVATAEQDVEESGDVLGALVDFRRRRGAC